MDFTSSSDFKNYLLDRYFEDLQVFLDDNYDCDRFSGDGIDRSAIPYPALHKAALVAVIEQADALLASYRLLKDTESRQLFIDLLRYRMAGHTHVRLPTNTPHYWSLVAQSKSYPYSPSTMQHHMPAQMRLGHCVFAFNGVPLEMDVFGIVWPFLTRQYFFDRGGVSITPQQGDVVIDAGAGIGDTALAFGACSGPTGRVYSFEIMPNAQSLCRHNFALNEHVCSFQLVPFALSDQEKDGSSDQPDALSFDLGYQNTAGHFPAVSLDRFVESEKVPRVDFIKMDIEGAEMSALRGAEKTLRRFKPRLAISIYHEIEDFFSIPLYLDGLGAGYRFYLDHYTIHVGETVLYAIAEGEP